MKTFKMVLTSFVLLFTIKGYAQDLSSSKIESIKLNTGKVISIKNEVESIQLNADRENNIDYLILREGTLIDSRDITNINISGKFDLSTIALEFQSTTLRMAANGDGSGG